MTRDRFAQTHALRIAVFALTLVVGGVAAHAQTAEEHEQQPAQNSVQDSLRELEGQVSELKSLVVEMREEVARSRAETSELRHELELTREQAVAPGAPSGGLPATGTPSAAQPAGGKTVAQRLANLEEDQQLLSAKVDDQYQTKVESGSKYRVRFSGIVLFNLFNNVGAVDNEDFPALAETPGPLVPGVAFGGSVRQSQLAFEAFGPEIGGARVSANIQFDFGGGFPGLPNGVALGLARLRTGTIHFDWGHTSIIVGQDGLFISPLAPTSLASLAIPAFSYSGDLWSWTPQIRVEHRLDFSDSSNLLLQAGILDSYSGEQPESEYQYVPQIGQTTRNPAYAARMGWTHSVFGRSFTAGEGGYYARQDWGFSRKVDAWAATTDWTIALATRWSLSGEFYRGRAVGGLGGGISGSIVLNGPITDPATVVRGLDSLGGWSQLKFSATNKTEFNVAFGQDNPLASEVRNSLGGQQNYFSPWLARNQTWLANVIYHPRSDVLLSLEYRHLHTFTTISEPDTANDVNMSVGVLF
jgi:hypothetical protein